MWTGEEEGLFGSQRICEGALRLRASVDDPGPAGAAGVYARDRWPLELKPEQKLISGYFNVDNGIGQDPRHLSAGERGGLAHLRAVDGAAQGPRRNDDHHAEYGRAPTTCRSTRSAFRAFSSSRTRWTTRAARTTPIMDVFERLQPGDLKQAASVEAIFVYNAAMRDQMLPRKPLPHPELRQQQQKPLPGVFPGAVEPAK